MSISSRLARLRAEAAHIGDDLLTVYYADGRTTRITSGECVALVMNGYTSGIVRFTGGSQNGLLPDLLTDLLDLN